VVCPIGGSAHQQILGGRLETAPAVARPVWAI
jgi:hypothetical protein